METRNFSYMWNWQTSFRNSSSLSEAVESCHKLITASPPPVATISVFFPTAKAHTCKKKIKVVWTEQQEVCVQVRLWTCYIKMLEINTSFTNTDQDMDGYIKKPRIVSTLSSCWSYVAMHSLVFTFQSFNKPSAPISTLLNVKTKKKKKVLTPS